MAAEYSAETVVAAAVSTGAAPAEAVVVVPARDGEERLAAAVTMAAMAAEKLFILILLIDDDDGVKLCGVVTSLSGADLSYLSFLRRNTYNFYVGNLMDRWRLRNDISANTGSLDMKVSWVDASRYSTELLYGMVGLKD